MLQLPEPAPVLRKPVGQFLISVLRERDKFRCTIAIRPEWLFRAIGVSRGRVPRAALRCALG